MDISVKKSKGDVNIRLVGHLDLDSAPILAEELERVLAQGPRSIKLDLSAIRQLSSTGVSILLKFSEVAEGAGCPCVIAKLSPVAQRVFELIGIQDSFTFGKKLNARIAS